MGEVWIAIERLHSHTFVDLLVAVTCTSIGRAVWIRRWTLRPSVERIKLVERTMTVGLILRAFALTLMSPASSATVGRLLHAVFRHWQLDTWMGHCLYLSAVAMTMINIRARLYLDADEIRAIFRREFGLPITVIAPVLLFLITKSPDADANWADLFDSPTDHWLDAYWTVLGGFTMYLLSRTLWVLHHLRGDARNRRTATSYMRACAGGVALCVLQVIDAWADFDYAHFFWVGNCSVAIVFARASGRAWVRKVRWLAPGVKL